MKKKVAKLLKKRVIRLLTVTVIVAGLIVIPPLLAEVRRATFAEQEVAAHLFTVRVETAEIRTLQSYIEVNANIVSADQVVVLPEANGRLASMRVNMGDIVQRGQILAEVDPSRPGAVFAMSRVYAPVSGRVITMPTPVGSTVALSSPLMTLAVDDSIEIVALIPERDVGQLHLGLSAQVRLEAFPSESFNATLTQLSPVVDPISRTKRVTLRFEQSDSRITPGMFARVRLNTRTHENVVSIPQDALVTHRGVTVVYVLYTPGLDDAERDYFNGAPEGSYRVEMREVVSGVTVNREVEIRSGLAPGEEVVVQGQQFLADGVAVRVIGRRI